MRRQQGLLEWHPTSSAATDFVMSERLHDFARGPYVHRPLLSSMMTETSKAAIRYQTAFSLNEMCGEMLRVMG